MPNASPPSPLPPLSDFESSLISSFLILRYDLVALAESNKLNPRQLIQRVAAGEFVLSPDAAAIRRGEP